MKLCKNKKALLIVALVCMMLFTSVVALAGNMGFYVKSQIYANTCWAACVSSVVQKIKAQNVSIATLMSGYGNMLQGAATIKTLAARYGLTYSSVTKSAARIQSEINANRNVIARIMPGGVGSHWVVVYGYNGTTFNIMDPAGGGYVGGSWIADTTTVPYSNVLEILVLTGVTGPRKK